jgi:hypothetical protein
MSNKWNNIERDEERIREFYSFERDIEGKYGWFTEPWFDFRYAFLCNIFDLSEDFHRHYCSFYNESHWKDVFEYQAVSEKFYDDFFDKIAFNPLVRLIKYGRVSPEWVERHKDKISPEVWEGCYK